MKNRLLVVLLLGSVAPLAAKVTLAPLFTDHAVLQRDKPVPIWGQAAPGEAVTVQFHGVTAKTTADATGAWKTQLPTQQASNVPSDLVVRGENTITLTDVVVGEVWLCSGQSNMEFVMWDSKGTTFRVQNGEAEVAAAHYPLIRQFTVARKVAATPLTVGGGKWEAATPETVPHFTAVGFFFARDLYRRLAIPVGIIDSTWGGTPVESWMSAEALASNPGFGVVEQRWQKKVADYPAARAAYNAKLAQWTQEIAAAHTAGTDAVSSFVKAHPKPRVPIGASTGDPWQPTGLFNGMIQPLVPYALRGMLWYQGEANGSPAGAKEYHAFFAAMITSWRAKFGQGNVPFYWVQLASFDHAAGWPGLREAQQQTLSLPNTGQALAIDIGQENNIHPRNKQEVGRRLALIAANQVYGIPVEYSGPMFAGVATEGAAMRVRFTEVRGGLKADLPVATCELAGADHKFYPATAAIEGSTLVVRSEQVPQPVAVRYAWAAFAEGHLYNQAGLPAAPFRSDDW